VRLSIWHIVTLSGPYKLQDRKTQSSKSEHVLRTDWSVLFSVLVTMSSELILAIGGTCGAVFLDDRFEQQMRTFATNQTFDEMVARNKLDLMDKWEYGAKRVFRHDCNDQQVWSYYVGSKTAKEVTLAR